MKTFFIILVCLLSFESCQFINNDYLNSKDINFIKSLGLLNDDEKIIWFDSQLSVRTSGNFLTDKRIASYVFDKYHPDNNYIEYAYLDEIDSIKLINNSNSLSYASFIKVYKKTGKNFNVYIDKDSLRNKEYYNQVLKMLEN